MFSLERNWNMWIPGFGMEDLKPYKKASATEAHKQVGVDIIYMLLSFMYCTCVTVNLRHAPPPHSLHVHLSYLLIYEYFNGFSSADKVYV